MTTTKRAQPPAAEPVGDCALLSIGAAAKRADVTVRALRYYEQLGLLTPAGSTSGGLRRYSEGNLVRVARIRELQSVLGLNLDEIAVVLRNEDRTGEIRAAYHHERTGKAERRRLARECLELQLELWRTVRAKQEAIDRFMADLDATIGRLQDLVGDGDTDR